MAENDSLVWLKALDIIKKDVSNDQIFNVWFGPIKFVSLSQDTITLEVPNKFFKTWLLDRYMNLINLGIQKASGRELNIDFVLGESGDEEVLQKTKAPEPKKEAKAFWPFAKQP